MVLVVRLLGAGTGRLIDVIGRGDDSVDGCAGPGVDAARLVDAGRWLVDGVARTTVAVGWSLVGAERWLSGAGALVVSLASLVGR
jgi:hypothetical protein